MSKIGKSPIKIPEGVNVAINDRKVSVIGPKGTLLRELPREVTAEIKDNQIVLSLKNEDAKAIYGTMRALIANMVQGVKEGWSKELELVGTGFRAEVVGRTLSLSVGYSHPVKIEAPEGINFKVEKTIITVEGVDRELVGQVAANIRGIRPPEPYKGKGIKYRNEVIRRKVGKAAKTEGAVA